MRGGEEEASSEEVSWAAEEGKVLDCRWASDAGSVEEGEGVAETPGEDRGLAHGEGTGRRKEGKMG